MEQKILDLAALLPLITEVFARGGEFELHPRGTSMLPTIREGRDTVMLSPLIRPPRRGDICLYRRDTGEFVLHRVVKCASDGTLSMRGDNQYFTERGIRHDQLIATVKRYFREGREIRTDAPLTRMRSFWRHFSYPLRRILRALVRRASRIFQGGQHG